MINFEIEFDKEFFYELPKEKKSTKELIELLIFDLSEMNVRLDKYSDSEINRCVRKLIENGVIRGTIIDQDKCIWSRLTRKGELLRDSLIKLHQFDECNNYEIAPSKKQN